MRQTYLLNSSLTRRKAVRSSRVRRDSYYSSCCCIQSSSSSSSISTISNGHVISHEWTCRSSRLFRKTEFPACSSSNGSGSNSSSSGINSSSSGSNSRCDIVFVRDGGRASRISIDSRRSSGSNSRSNEDSSSSSSSSDGPTTPTCLGDRSRCTLKDVYLSSYSIMKSSRSQRLSEISEMSGNRRSQQQQQQRSMNSKWSNSNSSNSSRDVAGGMHHTSSSIYEKVSTSSSIYEKVSTSQKQGRLMWIFLLLWIASVCSNSSISISRFEGLLLLLLPSAGFTTVLPSMLPLLLLPTSFQAAAAASEFSTFVTRELSNNTSSSAAVAADVSLETAACAFPPTSSPHTLSNSRRLTAANSKDSDVLSLSDAIPSGRHLSSSSAAADPPNTTIFPSLAAAAAAETTASSSATETGGDIEKATATAAAGPQLDYLGLPVRKNIYRAKLYGSMFSYAYYFLDILVGTPPQRASVILDTGSSLLAFPCKGCTDCGQHLDPAIDTGLTSTGEWVECTEKERCFGTCSRDAVFRGKLRNENRVGSSSRCMYTQTYSEGSSIRGIYMSDFVALGELQQKNPFVRYDFVGCHVEETNLFVTQKAAGIFGISFPKGHRQPTLLDVMFQHSELVDRKLFSICISEDGGLLTVGGYEASLLVAPPEVPPSTPATVFPWPAASSNTASYTYPAANINAAAVAGGGNAMYTIAQQQGRNIIGGIPGEGSGGLAAALAAEEGRKTSPHYSDLIGWTPIISHSTYRVLLERMEVEGLVLGHDREDFGNTMVDSGTTYSYFPPAVFARWRQFLNRLCTPELFCERERDGRLCWRVSPGTDLTSLFPPIKVVFGYSLAAGATAAAKETNTHRGGGGRGGGKEEEENSFPHEQVVWWRPEGYLYRRTGGYFCDGFDDNRTEASVLGLSFFKNKLVVFDRERDRVGFAAAQCPSFYIEQRPSIPSEQSQPVSEATPDTFPSPAAEVEDAGGVSIDDDVRQPAWGEAAEEKNHFSFFTLSAFAMWLLLGGAVVSLVLAMALILYNTTKLHTFSSVVVPAESAFPAAAAVNNNAAAAAIYGDDNEISRRRSSSSSDGGGGGGERGGVCTDAAITGGSSTRSSGSSTGRSSRRMGEVTQRSTTDIQQLKDTYTESETIHLTPNRHDIPSRGRVSTAAAKAAQAAANLTTVTAAKAGTHLSHFVQKAAAASAARLKPHRSLRRQHHHLNSRQQQRQEHAYLNVVTAPQPFSPGDESFYDMEAEGDSMTLINISEEEERYGIPQASPRGFACIADSEEEEEERLTTGSSSSNRLRAATP